MITIEVDQEQLSKIETKLSNLSKARQSQRLRTAINRTARKAAQRSRQNASHKYVVTNADVREKEHLSTATRFDGGAEVKYTSPAVGLEHFKYRAGKRGITVKVLRSGSYKLLKEGNRKAFVGGLSWQSKSGESGVHQSILQRKTSSHLPVKHLYGTTVPKMVEVTARDQGEEDKILEDLQNEIEAAINAALGGS